MATTKLDVEWSHDHQTWIARDPKTPGLCGVHTNKTKARAALREAQDQYYETMADQKLRPN